MPFSPSAAAESNCFERTPYVAALSGRSCLLHHRAEFYNQRHCRALACLLRVMVKGNSTRTSTKPSQPQTMALADKPHGSPHGSLHSSTLPHWVVRDTMTSATTIPRFVVFRFSTLSTTSFPCIFSSFVGFAAPCRFSIAIFCSTFHKQETHPHACCQLVTPQQSPPCSEPIAALSGLRPRNGQSAACNCRMAYGPARKCNQSQD